jgi:hypothetical protein
MGGGTGGFLPQQPGHAEVGQAGNKAAGRKEEGNRKET